MPKGLTGLLTELQNHLILETGDGFLKGHLLLLREIGNGHAGCLKFLQDLLLLGLQGIPPPSRNLSSTCLQKLPGLFLQVVPDLGIGYEQVILIGVVPHGQVVLHFLHFGSGGDTHTVLLAIDGALLNGGEYLTPVHGGGVSPQGPEEAHVHHAARHPNFQVFQILRGVDLVLGVGDLPESVVEGTQIGHVFSGQPLSVILAASGVDDLPGLGVIIKNPWDGGHRKLAVHHR